MKRNLTLALAALLGLFAASCQKDPVVPASGKNGMVDFTISTSINSGLTTYASNNGGAINVNSNDYSLRYILEAWTDESTPRLAYRGYKIVDDNFTETDVTFSARLLSMKYNFVFWADFVEDGTTEDTAESADLHYTTHVKTQNQLKLDPTGDPGLTAITFKNTIYSIADDTRDAYYKTVPVDLTDGGFVGTVTLKRPFGKYRIVATDAPEGYLSPSTVVDKVKLTFSNVAIPSTFNASTGVSSGSLTLDGDFEAVPYVEDVVAGGKLYEGAYVLAFDYIFEATGTSAYPFTVSAYEGSDLIASRELSDIPIVENKLTTVIGDFFTNTAVLNIIVDDVFEDGTVIDARNVYNQPITGDMTFVVPTAVGGQAEYVIILSGAISDDITISFVDENTSNPYTGLVKIAILQDASGADIDIDLPGASVYFMGTVNSITSATADDTLILARNTVVNDVTLNKGGLKIYGTITGTITNGGSGKVWHVVGPESARPISGAVVKEAMAYAKANTAVDGLIFSEGQYPLNSNMGSNFIGANGINYSAQGESFYFVIDIEGFTVKSDDGANVILYGDQEKPNGQISFQNLVTVLADDVTIEGITFMTKSAVNKSIEFYGGDGVLRNCTITPNTIKGYDSTYAGNIYFNNADGGGTIEGCTINNACILFYGLKEGRIYTVKDNTFNGMRHNDYPSVLSFTVGSDNDVNVTATGNTFNTPPHGGAMSRYAFEAQNGTFNLAGNTYNMGAGVYWKATGTGTINNDYGSTFTADSWDGVTTEAPETSDNVNYTIASAEQLADFAAMVNGGETFAGKTITLTEDIDLLGYEWTPIGNGSNAFMGTFDGDGYTISNFVVDATETMTDAGLFGRLRNGTIRNVTISNANISAVSDGSSGTGVVVGKIFPNGLVSGVSVIDATLTANRYLGGISGYIYGSIDGCSVENIVITSSPDELKGPGDYDNGDKVGGIVGYVGEGNNNITNNTVANATIKAYRDMGGIAGAIQTGVTLTGNTVNGAVITVDPTKAYGSAPGNAAAIVGRNIANADLSGNSDSGVIVKGL